MGRKIYSPETFMSSKVKRHQAIRKTLAADVARGITYINTVYNTNTWKHLNEFNIRTIQHAVINGGMSIRNVLTFYLASNGMDYGYIFQSIDTSYYGLDATRHLIFPSYELFNITTDIDDFYRIVLGYTWYNALYKLQTGTDNIPVAQNDVIYTPVKRVLSI